MKAEQRAAITEVLHRYAMLIDAGQYDQLDRIFTPDAHVTMLNHSADGVDNIAAYCAKALRYFVAVQHQISTVMVEDDSVRSGGARTSCALFAVHVHDPALRTDPFAVGGRYDDRLIETDAGWRITHRTLTSIWQTGKRHPTQS